MYIRITKHRMYDIYWSTKLINKLNVKQHKHILIMKQLDNIKIEARTYLMI